MKNKILISFIFFNLSVSNCFSQLCTPPDKGVQNDVIYIPGFGFYILGIGSWDPNQITTPKGYDSARWVSVHDKMGVSIFFENDPNLATAPVHNAYIYYPFPPKQDPASFRVGSFGFNGMVFTIPPGLNFYQSRLDLRDSLGLYVDVTAGINVVNNTAFWIFQSIDPLTNQPPLDPLKGFLPIKDTSSTGGDSLHVKGEGFVNFTAAPMAAAQTGDTIFARAKIVFDVNDTIPTNTEFNTIDALPPFSAISSNITDSNKVQLYIHTQDDAGGSGVKEYDLFVAKDSGSYFPYLIHAHDSIINFSGLVGSAYRLYTLATDQVGNREALKTVPDQVVLFGSNRRWYVDADNDGFGNIFHFVSAYYKPNGYVPDSSDCNDHDPFVSTGCTEICRDSGLVLSSNIPGLSYQWQVNPGTGFTNISDNSNYSGTTTASLQLHNAPTSWYGYDYRCAVPGNFSRVFSLKFTNTWTGSISSAWENPANWGCGTLPDANTDVIVNQGTNLPVLNSNQSIRSLKLAPGKNITVNANYQLTITGPPQ